MPPSIRSRVVVRTLCPVWTMGRTLVPDRPRGPRVEGGQAGSHAATVRASRWYYWEVAVRKLGMVLAGLGGFLVMLAILAKFYAPGQLMKTPLDVDSTTNAAGQAAVGDGATEPVKGTQLTRADSAKSDDDVIVFVSSSCLIFDRDNAPSCVNADDPDQRLITAGVDNFATDRKTALAVNDPKYLPPDAT